MHPEVWVKDSVARDQCRNGLPSRSSWKSHPLLNDQLRCLRWKYFESAIPFDPQTPRIPWHWMDNHACFPRALWLACVHNLLRIAAFYWINVASRINWYPFITSDQALHSKCPPSLIQWMSSHFENRLLGMGNPTPGEWDLCLQDSLRA